MAWGNYELRVRSEELVMVLMGGMCVSSALVLRPRQMWVRPVYEEEEEEEVEEDAVGEALQKLLSAQPTFEILL